MKKIVCLLVAIAFFSCDRQYDNFKITGIKYAQQSLLTIPLDQRRGIF